MKKKKKLLLKRFTAGLLAFITAFNIVMTDGLTSYAATKSVSDTAATEDNSGYTKVWVPGETKTREVVTYAKVWVPAKEVTNSVWTTWKEYETHTYPVAGH